LASSIVGSWPAGTHQSTRYVSSFSNHRLRLRITDVWPLAYTNERSASIDSHTDMLTIIRSSS